MPKVRHACTRCLAVLLAVLMLPISSFAVDGGRQEGAFKDVGTDDWFRTNVMTAYQMGIMVGVDDAHFDPSGSLTIAQAVTLAARIHSADVGDDEPFTESEPWFQTYADYALKHGILEKVPEDWNAKATRLDFAKLLDDSLPANKLQGINTVDDGAIPDVANNKNVYHLYRAGVLVGSDAKGTFRPDSNISRAEVAAIVTRMLDTSLRQTLTLRAERKSGTGGSSSEPIANPKTGGISADPENAGEAEEETPQVLMPFDMTNPDDFSSKDTLYSNDYILVKMGSGLGSTPSADLRSAGIASLSPSFKLGEKAWYKAYLDEGRDIQTVIAAVRGIDGVDAADFDYAYEAEGTLTDSSAAANCVQGNTFLEELWYLLTGHLQRGWEWMSDPQRGDSAIPVGGSPSVVVAVIDTGVDYNHEDLKANIFVNTAEIPKNGIDDDKNGYVDDYYGYDTVADMGSAMDDQGHGTHVAGIIAAANNNLGTCGVAFNTKILPVKAGGSSGYFHQSDIAEAVVYAHDMGANVINMSFGGVECSTPVQEALIYAYTDCVLVASAGNDSACNENNGVICGKPNYPAALPYVLGVMSVDENGRESYYSNYDKKAYNGVEYEVYAPGEGIKSCIPNDGYASWSGTSMAAPYVSGVAALLRSYYSDTSMYPTKFIYGQIAATGVNSAVCCDPEQHGLHNIPKIVDAYNALTVLPKPEVSVSDYLIFDTKGLGGNMNNNGDGVIDAGETIALGFTLRNRWGMSKNTMVTIDKGENPYVQFDTTSINYGSVGTYSTQDCGKLTQSDNPEVITGWEHPFLMTVDKDIPNDYYIKLNVTASCENALDATDTELYTSLPTETLLTARRGSVLPNKITEDMTLKADTFYIIPNAMIIAEGVTVTVEPGTQIQFWSDDPNDAYADTYIAYLQVKGSFICNGTADKPVRLFPSELMDMYRVQIEEVSGGTVELNYTNVVNGYLNISSATGCRFTQNYLGNNDGYSGCYGLYNRYLDGGTVRSSYGEGRLSIGNSVECVYEKLGFVMGNDWGSSYEIAGRCDGCVFVDSYLRFSEYSRGNAPYGITNCVFYGNTNTNLSRDAILPSRMTTRNWGAISVDLVTYDENAGTTYVFVEGLGGPKSENWMITERTAKFLGGEVVTSFSETERQQMNNLLTEEIRKRDYSYFSTNVSADGSFSYYYDKTVNGENRSYSSSGRVIAIANVSVEDIVLSARAVALDTESSYQLRATAKPDSAANAILIYESSDESVATVTAGGLIQPVAVGEATIKVFSPDRYIYNTLAVTVKDRVPLQQISLPDSVTMDVGTNRALDVTVVPSDTTRRNFVYESSDTAVVSVDGQGTMTAKGVGSAQITVTGDGNITATVPVTVVSPSKGVAFDDWCYVTDLTSEDGRAFYPKIYPADSTQTELVWESSNPDVAYVDESGALVKANIGIAKLRATVSGTDLYAELIVSVTESVENFEIVHLTRYDDNSVFALTGEGELWTWGNGVPVPKKLDTGSTRLVGFAKYPYGSDLYLLDNGGTVWKTSYDSSNGSLNEKSVYLSGVRQLTSGYTSFYALKQDGSVWAWGENYNGQLGVGNTTTYNSPVQMDNLRGIAKIAASSSLFMALNDNGQVWYCGRGSDESVMTPKVLRADAEDIYPTGEGTGNSRIVVRTGSSVFSYCSDGITNPYSMTLRGDGQAIPYEGETCFYINGGKVYVRGSNNYGRLGTGTTEYVSSFTVMPGIENAKRLFVSYGQTYIVTSDGKLYGCGQNDRYQLGNLSAKDSATPVRIYLGLNGSENGPKLEDNGLDDDGVLRGDALTLDFDQAIEAGSAYPNITLKDSSGGIMSVRKNRKLDKLELAPDAAWSEDETYTLNIPADALCGITLRGNEAISLTFTITATDSPAVTRPAKSVAFDDWCYVTDRTSEDGRAFYPTIYPANATETELVWESSNPEVAYVDESGALVKGATGLARLRATVKGTSLYAELIVSVTESVGNFDIVQMAQYNNGSVFALTGEGTLWTWGNGVPVPKKLDTGLTRLVGFAKYPYDFALYLLDESGTVWKTSYDSSNGSLSEKSVYLSGVRQLTSGNTSFYALKQDGSVWAWGENYNGQLGVGNTTTYDSPVQMDNLQSITKIAASNSLFMALDSDGQVWYCGRGSNENVMTPIVLRAAAEDIYSTGEGSGDFRIVVRAGSSVFSYHSDGTANPYSMTLRGDGQAIPYDSETCFYINGGKVYVRGYSYYGRLGTGTTDHVSGFTAIPGIENAERLFVSYEQTYIVTSDGKLYGCGRNDRYQLGNLSTKDSSVPVGIYLGLEGPESGPALVNNGLDNNVLRGNVLTLDFDQAIEAGSMYPNITLKDSSNSIVSVRKTRKLDKLELTPNAGWSESETYTLNIPANALCSITLQGNEEISLTFTYTAPVSLRGTGNTLRFSLLRAEKPSDTGLASGARINPDATREYLTLETVQAKIDEFVAKGLNTTFYHNAILNRFTDTNPEHWLRIQAPDGNETSVIGFGGNYWGTTDRDYIGKQIIDFDDYTQYADINEGEFLTEPPEDVWPFAVRAYLLNKEGVESRTIGNEAVTFCVEFNRDMDTSIDLGVYFGSAEPYADYQIDGNWITPRLWQGSTTLTTVIENGTQYITVSDGRAADNHALTLFRDWKRFSFEIDTASAQALLMQGNATDSGIALKWSQDDFDTLAGYNIYRAESADGHYSKINNTVIPAGTDTWFDEGVLPGETYWYCFKVVKTDLTESAATGKCVVTAKDTMPATVSHSPVYSTFTGMNLPISAVVQDNVMVASVTLCYRARGESEWKRADMSKLNDKFTAIISANYVTTAGLEYYIDAFDGVNHTLKGNAESPYQVTVQEAISENTRGDVDGNGRINALDALLVLQGRNQIVILSQEEFFRADLDGDGELTAAEALAILRYANGKIGSLTLSGG